LWYARLTPRLSPGINGDIGGCDGSSRFDLFPKPFFQSTNAKLNNV
jgi:hypothetical protein